jgi:hypothetical protein
MAFLYDILLQEFGKRAIAKVRLRLVGSRNS